MKLRNPMLIGLAAWLGSGVMRGLSATVRRRGETYGQPVDPEDPTHGRRYIYAFWHENLLALGMFRPVTPAALLASRSADGELAARLCRRFGVEVIRGSSSRGGLEAIDELVAVAARCHLLVAPDGPRGPRREVKRGLVSLASWTGLPVVPLGIAYRSAWRTRGWDRAAVPRPFTLARVIAGPAVTAPPEIGRAEAERLRREIERRLLTATELAEAWAADTAPRWPAGADFAAATTAEPDRPVRLAA